jgi:hypothetical protein
MTEHKYSDQDREIVREVLHILYGQVVGIDTVRDGAEEFQNYIIHEPFFTVWDHFGMEGLKDDR